MTFLSLSSLVALSLCLPCVWCGHLHLLARDTSNTLQWGVLDPSNGQFDSKPLTLPSPPSGCTWVFLNGTHGEASTSLSTNSTLFFLGVQQCAGGATHNTTLFSVMPYGYVRIVAQFPEFDKAPIKPSSGAPNHARSSGARQQQINIVWDWVSNVVVIHKTVNDTDADNPVYEYTSVEVSIYDGAKRPLPTLGTYPQLCGGDCWQRVDGLAGISGAENGGTDSVLYNLEQHQVDYNPVVPFNLVGRGLHNGSVVANTTDYTQLQTVSYLPHSYGKDVGSVFIGLGVCCELGWCPPACEGHGTFYSLVSFQSSSDPYPRVIQIVNATTPATTSTTTAPDSLTVRLGVAVDITGFPVTPDHSEVRVSVWGTDHIMSYVLTQGDYGTIISKVLAVAVVPPGVDPIAWTYFGY